MRFACITAKIQTSALPSNVFDSRRHSACCRHSYHRTRAGHRAACLLQRTDRGQLPDRGLRLHGRRGTIRRLPACEKREPQDLERGLRLRAGARLLGQVRQVRRRRALYLALRIGRVRGRTDPAQRQWLRRSQIPIVGQPLWGAGTDAEGVQGLRAGPDRRRKPAGVGAVGPVRSEQAGQHRHPPLVLQAGGGRLQGGGSVDAGVPGRGNPLHGQQGLLPWQHPFTGPASTRCRGM